MVNDQEDWLRSGKHTGNEQDSGADAVTTQRNLTRSVLDKSMSTDEVDSLAIAEGAFLLGERQLVINKS